MAAVDLSFVIPVRNDAARLRRCLQSIAESAREHAVEVVVVDNGSTDASAAVARDAGARVITAPRLAVAALRNLGTRQAQGALVAFVDADHLLDRGWVAAAIEDLAVPAIAAAGLLCRAPEDGTWVQRAYDRLRGRQQGRGPTDWLGAGNMIVRRTAFSEIGGFDERLETCEDVDLCKRLRAAGYTLLRDDRLGNVHLGDPATLGDLFRSELWRGRSNLVVSLRPPVTWRELPSAVGPVLLLAALASLPLAALIGGATGGRVALGAIALLLGLPAVRALRMLVQAGGRRPADVAATVAVAFVYELARALALIAFATHGIRRERERA